MKDPNKVSGYYGETKIKLIDSYKKLVEQCIKIMDMEIPDELSEDKLHNVLKGKRMASEDAKFYAKEIEQLENEQNGVETVQEDKKPKKGIEKFSKD